MDDTALPGTLRRIALRAGKAIMDIYDGGDLGTRAKADESPVTLADEAADRLIAAALAEAFPDIAIVTEEQAASHDTRADRFFIVDPLDGTKEFVQRRGDFTVNIALVEGGVPVRGVVYAPAKGRLFYTDAQGRAVEEAGPFDPDTPGTTTPLAVRTPDPQALIVVASKSHRDAATDDYINRYAVADMAAAGSSLKFCLVAAGRRTFIRGSAGRWNGIPPPARRCFWVPGAGSCASTTTRRSDTASPAMKTPSSSPMLRASIWSRRDRRRPDPRALCLHPVSGQTTGGADWRHRRGAVADPPQLGGRAGNGNGGHRRGDHG